MSVPASATYDIATTYLTGGGLTLDGDRSLASLGVYGGTLAGAGTRTVTGSAVLDNGTLAGNGRTVIGPGAHLSVGTGGGGTLTINGGHVLAIDAGATATWGPGPHDIQLDAPSRIENAGELDITNDRSLRGSGTLANTGTLRKLSHGTTTLALLLDDDGLIVNPGSMEIVAGVLTLEAAGLDNEGTLRIDSTSAQAGQLRTTAFHQSADGALALGMSGRTPGASAGNVVVSGARTELDGALQLVPDTAFEAANAQQVALISTTAEPAGAFATTSGLDQLPGGQPADVQVVAQGVILVIGGP